MGTIDLTSLVLPSTTSNTDDRGGDGVNRFNTTDYVWLPSKSSLQELNCSDRLTSATDFAVACGVFVSDRMFLQNGKRTVHYWLRSNHTPECPCYVTLAGDISHHRASTSHLGIRPLIKIHAESIAILKNHYKDFAKLDVVKDKNGLVEYHTIEIGEYPKSKATISDELESDYRRGVLKETGRIFTTYHNLATIENKEYEYDGEKYVRSQVLAGLFGCTYADESMASGAGDFEWFKVEPIVWRILNWYTLPKSINKEGYGLHDYIELQTDEVILGGLPFYPNEQDYYRGLWQNSSIRGFLNGIDLSNDSYAGNRNFMAYNGGNFEGNGFLQQAFGQVTNTSSTGQAFGQFANANSTQHAVGQTSSVNQAQQSIGQTGVNQTQQAVGHGSVASPVQQGGNFMNNDQFGKILGTNQNGSTSIYARKSRLQKLNPDTTPASNRRKMTDTETIKSWVDAGQSVLLRGPSGIGKTERLKKLYPDLIYIKLTNNMFPEKVVGSMNLQTGQAIPPDFAKQALMSCATPEEKKLIQENIQNLYELADTIYERSKTSDKKTVILLDELLNVKPAVQSLVYTLVLNKIIETGKGLKLPANTVVVATGNQKKYSNVAEDLAEPLEKRFDHILDMEPKVGEWLTEYAIPNKLHPAVVGYIFSKYNEKRRSEKIRDMGYFYEEPEVGEDKLDRNGCRGRTNDPRGWASISNTLYAFEQDLTDGKFKGIDVEALLAVSLSSKLRSEWAREFYDFYNNPTLSVEDVVNWQYREEDLPRDVNEKFAYMAGLLSADEKQVKACREFIKKHCGAEYLSVYDLYWTGTDDNRAMQVSEMQEMEN